MNTEEIFNKLASHMIEGVFYHDSFAKAYDFLGLYGFAKCHLYHNMEELENYHKLAHYYSTHYHKLIITTIENNNLIPATWYKYSSMAVDGNTRQNAIRDFTTKWITWEQQTKKLYEESREQLYQIGEIAAALYIDNYILDVTKELKHAEKLLLKLESINYDMPTIIDWQAPLCNKYKHKLGW